MKIKTLPKKVLSARLAVTIVTELEPNTSEKPKAQPRSTPAVTNGSVRKPTVAKAASDIIDLSDHDQESEVDVERNTTGGTQTDVRVPDSTKQSQQQMFDHWSASRVSTTIEQGTTTPKEPEVPPAPAGLAVDQANVVEDTRCDKRAESVEQDVTAPASIEAQAKAESNGHADDAAQGDGGGENAGGVMANGMVVNADESIDGVSVGSNAVPEEAGTKKGP